MSHTFTLSILAGFPQLPEWLCCSMLPRTRTVITKLGYMLFTCLKPASHPSRIASIVPQVTCWVISFGIHCQENKQENKFPCIILLHLPPWVVLILCLGVWYSVSVVS